MQSAEIEMAMIELGGFFAGVNDSLSGRWPAPRPTTGSDMFRPKAIRLPCWEVDEGNLAVSLGTCRRSSRAVGLKVYMFALLMISAS